MDEGADCASLAVRARFRPGFEQVEQAAVLEQQLLRAKRQRAFAGTDRIGAERGSLARPMSSSGRVQAGTSMPGAAGGAVEQPAHCTPVARPRPSPRQARSHGARTLASVSSAWRWATKVASVWAAPAVDGSGPTAEVSRTR